MTVVRSAFAKTTVQGIAAMSIIGTACYLAVSGAIDGPSFLGLAIVVAGFYFNKNAPSAEK